MYKSILLPVDLDDPQSWGKPLTIATELAQTHGAALHLYNVVPSFRMNLVSQYFPTGYEEKLVAEAEQRLVGFREKHVPATIPGTASIGQGSVHRQVIAKSKELNCDLVIIGYGSDSISHFILGSNGVRIVNESNVSVLIVR